MLGEDLHARALVAAVTDHKLTGVLHHSNLGKMGKFGAEDFHSCGACIQNTQVKNPCSTYRVDLFARRL
jgi:hypothetical protein